MGILPQFNQSALGMRLQMSRFVHPSENFNANDLDSRVLEDQFYRSEFWWRYRANNRLQVQLHLPLAVHRRLESQRTTSISGLGDIRIQALYALIIGSDSSSSWDQQLWIGGGVQLPTGKYMQRDDTETLLPANFQLGQGSLQYSPSLQYSLRYKAWGFQHQVQYSRRGTNELDYDFGNQFSWQSSLFYWKQWNSFSAVLAAGFRYDSFQQDRQYDVPKPDTGGALMQLSLSADVYVGEWMYQAYAQIPLRENSSLLQPTAMPALGMGLAHFF